MASPIAVPADICAAGPGKERINFDELSISMGRPIPHQIVKKGNALDILLPTLTYRGAKIYPVNYIGGGSYGLIYRYADKDQQYELVVKVLTSARDKEAEVVRNLSADVKLCNIVGAMSSVVSAAVNELPRNIVIMNSMTGDLTQLASRMPFVPLDMFLDIMEELARTALCIFNAGYCYTDYKAPNILYQCVGVEPGAAMITLAYGDLGSIVPLGATGITTSYPSLRAYPRGQPIEHLHKHPAEEQDMVWGIFITMINMCADAHPPDVDGRNMDLLRVANEILMGTFPENRPKYKEYSMMNLVARFVELMEMDAATSTVLMRMYTSDISLEGIVQELAARAAMEK